MGTFLAGTIVHSRNILVLFRPYVQHKGIYRSNFEMGYLGYLILWQKNKMPIGEGR